MSADLQNNKRMLFLAYWFPPVQAVASLRTYRIAKFLSQKGWHITVVTPSPEHWRTIDHDGRMESLISNERVKVVTTGHRWRCLSPEHLNSWDTGAGYFLGGAARKITDNLGLERQLGWLKEAKKACSGFSAGDFDIVLASGGPFASFRLAKDLSEKLSCPFVLDYRDLWTGNPHRDKRDRQSTVDRERAIFNACAAAMVVSPSMKEHLVQRFQGGEKTHVLTNGFDPDELAAVKPFEYGHFSIVYAGIFYVPTSTIRPVMAALQILKRSMTGERSDWRFHYYGLQEDYVREEAQKYGVLDRVTTHGVKPRQEILSAFLGANVAVVITSVNAEATLEEKGIVTGKLFEPLGLGTPIMLIAPRGNDAACIVQATGVGGQFHGGETEEMASFLRGMIAGRTARAQIPGEFSWELIAEEMDSILRKIAAREVSSESSLT